MPVRYEGTLKTQYGDLVNGQAVNRYEKRHKNYNFQWLSINEPIATMRFHYENLELPMDTQVVDTRRP